MPRGDEKPLRGSALPTREQRSRSYFSLLTRATSVALAQGAKKHQTAEVGGEAVGSVRLRA